MAFEEIKENFAEAEVTFKACLETNRQYYKLKGFKMLMKGVITLSKVVLVSIILLIALLFLSVSGALWIGTELGDTAQGFLVVGLAYVFLGILIYLLRNTLRKPILKKFSGIYFDEI